MVGCGLWNGVAKFDRVDATLPGGGSGILPPPPAIRRLTIPSKALGDKEIIGFYIIRVE